MTTKRLVVVHRETTIIEYTEGELAELILKASGLEGGDVEFDVSTGGYLRGATVKRTLESTEEK